MDGAAEAFPTVSLVVLSWNGRDDADKCMTSLMDLDYPEDRLELILCDNGSTDGTSELVRARYPRVRVLKLDRNYGFAEGNNRAAFQATGEWLGFLNNDLRVDSQWLLQMVAAARRHPKAASLASRMMNWDGTRLDFAGGSMNFHGFAFQPQKGARPESSSSLPKRLLFACGGAMLVRRDLFLEVGGFDPDYFIYFEDLDLGWRLNLLGHQVWYVPEAVVNHRHHGATKKFEAHGTHLLSERNALATIYKCFDDEHLAAILPAALLLLNERGLLFSLVEARDYAVGKEGAKTRPRRATYWPLLVQAALNDLKSRRFSALATKARGFVTAKMLQRAIPDTHVLVPKLAFSPLLAASQFGHRLDSLAAKRKWLQSRRRVPDEALFPLFLEPFRAGVADQGYSSFQAFLCEQLGIESMFTSEACPAAREA